MTDENENDWTAAVPESLLKCEASNATDPFRS